MKLLALIKKELVRFFRDPKLLLTMILPGLVIFLIYSIMGEVMWNMTPTYEFQVEKVGSSVILEGFLDEAVKQNEGWSLSVKQAESVEAAKKKVESGELSALIVFSENFDETHLTYTPLSGTPAPQVEIFYRSADENSAAFYELASGIFEGYEQTISNKFNLNTGEDDYDFSGETELFTSVFGSVLPFLVVALIFSACMGVTLESVAGEKERGTLATVLVTSVKRTHVALGKVIPLSLTAMIGALSSFLGVVLSLPKLAGMSIGSFTANYSFGAYVGLFFLILSIVPLIVAAISAVSTFAKTVKEASAYTSIIMIFIVVLSLLSSFVGSIGAWATFIPVLNAVVAMQNILSLSAVVWETVVSILLNLVYTGALVALIAWMLGNERIMFGK